MSGGNGKGRRPVKVVLPRSERERRGKVSRRAPRRMRRKEGRVELVAKLVFWVVMSVLRVLMERRDDNALEVSNAVMDAKTRRRIRLGRRA